MKGTAPSIRMPARAARRAAALALALGSCASLLAGGCGGGGKGSPRSSASAGAAGCSCRAGDPCASSLDCGAGRSGAAAGAAAGEAGLQGAGAGGRSSAGGSGGEDSANPGAAGASAGADDASAGAAGAGGASTGPALSDFCTEFADKTCTWRKACRNAQDCSSGLGAACQALAKEAQAGRFDYVPAGGQACLDSIRTDTCKFFFDPDACATAFVGRQGLTDSCYDSYEHDGGFGFFLFGNECKEGYCSSDANCGCTAYAGVDDDCQTAQCDPETEYCGSDDKCHEDVAPDGDCSSGTCEPGYACVSIAGNPTCLAGRVEPGGDCQGTPQCLGGDVCKDGKCAPKVLTGDPCTGDFNCPSGTVCAGAPDGTCTPYAELGESCATLPCNPDPSKQLGCDLSAQCVTLPEIGDDCVLNGLACQNGWCADLPTPQCRALGKQGDDCGDDDPAPFNQRCEANLFCVPSGLDSQNVATGWHCEPVGAKGDPCQGDYSCQAGLYCDINGTHACTGLLGQGQTGCYGDADCQTNLFCYYANTVAPGACTARYVNGHDCSSSNECVSDYCLVELSATSGKCAVKPGPTPSPSMCPAP